MKTGVLLVNFGGPRSLEEVPEFLTNMMGRERAQAMLAPLVDRYRAIGGGSPLAAITDEQAALLEREMGKPFPIHAAYQYSHPSIGERIEQARASGVERLAFLAMSPFSSSLTTGAYLKAIETSLGSLSYRPAITFISGWCEEPAFVDCWAERIKAESTGGRILSSLFGPQPALFPQRRAVQISGGRDGSGSGTEVRFRKELRPRLAKRAPGCERALDRPFGRARARQPGWASKKGGGDTYRLRERPSRDPVRYGHRPSHVRDNPRFRIFENLFSQYV